MANIAVVFVFLLMALQAFQFSRLYGLANRTFAAIGPHLVETAIRIPGFDTAATAPCFDADALEAKIVFFMSRHLFPNIRTFTLEFYYFDPANLLVCSEACQGVSIAFNAPLTAWFDYQAELSFEIAEQP